MVATRDRPQLLRKAVDAALAQDYAGPVEVLAVFDQTEPEPDLEPRRRPPHGARAAQRAALRACRVPATPASSRPHIRWWRSATTTTAGCPASSHAQVAQLDRLDADAAITGIRVLYGDAVRDRVLAETGSRTPS